ncbi:MAG: DUF5947 family protein [Chthoniobacterales bacterium]
MARSSIAALRRFAGSQPAATVEAKRVEQAPEEFCELCNVRLASEHRHMLETATRKIVCACDACTMTFVPVVGGRYQVIPRDPRALPDFQMSDPEWEALSLPISLAFFFYHTPNGKMVALYPSPAGATESLLPLPAWETLVAHNPALRELEPDVEALLLNRVKEKREHFIVPIDKCFELVGTIRIHWRGLSGGDELWQKIDEFFAALHERAR